MIAIKPKTIGIVNINWIFILSAEVLVKLCDGCVDIFVILGIITRSKVLIIMIATVKILNALEKMPTCWYVPNSPSTTHEILVYKLSCPFGSKYANDERNICQTCFQLIDTNMIYRFK
ncbi:hypothetical protein SASK122_03540 [Staphylococcus argenteus]